MSILDELQDALQRTKAAGPPKPRSVIEELEDAITRRGPSKKKRVKVKAVLDGDTIDAETVGRLRIMGVNTPEVAHRFSAAQPGSTEAQAALQELLKGGEADVILNEDEPLDAYGRKLASVFVPGERESIGERFVREGRGIKLDVPLPDEFNRAPRPGALAKSMISAVAGGFAKGVAYPIGAFIPETYGWLQDVEQNATRNIAQELRARGAMKAPMAHSVAGVYPGVSEFVGNVVPFMGTYGMFLKASGAAKAATFAERAARTAGASLTQASLFAAGAELDEGESRLSRIVRDTALTGGFELIGFALATPCLVVGTRGQSGYQSHGSDREADRRVVRGGRDAD
jgi:endonuclease YncB( thermonuclease family)